MSHLFAYGTLMCEDIMRQVTGTTFKSGESILHGFIRKGLRNRNYPGIKRQECSQVQGIIYFYITESAWRKLDRYESEIYRRHLVTLISPCNANSLKAYVYVVRPEYENLLSQSDWDYQQFLYYDSKNVAK